MSTGSVESGAGWRPRVSARETRITAPIAVLVVLVIQLLLPTQLTLPPHWLVPALTLLLLIGVVFTRAVVDRESRVLRANVLLVAAAISVGNAWAVLQLISALFIGGRLGHEGIVLASIGGVWLSNMLVFALWYWELDRGGPVARAYARKAYPDFLFAQMAVPDLAPPGWRPTFVDYLFLSFTTAATYGPTSVTPMSRWAKLAMMAQAQLSLVLVLMVIGRLVNIVG